MVEALGAGVMRELIHETDWARTPLGPVETWSTNLRIALDTCLTSRAPTIIWWGPKLTILYNDAFIPLLGNKHPDALGKPGSEVWSEIWDEVGPKLAEAMARGGPCAPRDQRIPIRGIDHIEEACATSVCSPILDEAGAVGGVFTVIVEITFRATEQRRLRTLRLLGERMRGLADPERAAAVAVETLAEDPRDVSTAAIYVVEVAGEARRCASTPSFPGDGDVRRTPIGETSPWPIAEAIRSGRLQLVGSPPEAVVVPIVRACGVCAALVVGIDRELPLDEGRLDFLALAAACIGAAFSAVDGAVSPEDMRRLQLEPRASILVIGVDPETRQRLLPVLMEHWLVETVDPGRDAMEVIGERRPDLVLTDGDEIARMIRRDPGTADLPVIVLSARPPLGGANAVAERELVARIRLQLVTAQLRASDQQHHERLKSLFENAPVPIAVLRGPDHVFELANDAWRRLVGGRQVIGQRVRDALPELAGQGVFRLLDRGYATGETVVGTEVPVRFDRSGTGVVEDTFMTFFHQPLRDTNGCYESTMAVVLDVTDQVAARRAVQDQAERLRLVLEASQLGDWELDLEGGSARHSLRHDQIFGYRERVRDWSYAHLLDHVAPEDRASVESSFRAAVASRGAWSVECRIRRADGASAWIELDARVQPRDGTFPTRMFGTVADITARKRSEEVVAQTLANLFAVFSEAPASIAVLRGHDLVIELANRTVLEVWGKDEHIIGTPLREALPEIRDQPLHEQLDEVLRSNTARHETEALVRLERGDVYFDYVLEPLQEPDGQVSRILLFAVDVTSRVEGRRALEAAWQQAETASRAKDEFLAMLGHELRNPLAPISTALELMRLRGDPTAANERAVIERQVSHLVRLVDDLLDVSRITRGKIELKRVRIELADVIGKAIEMSSPLLEQRFHDLRVSVPQHGLAVDGDPMRLAQVVANLLTNAAKYTEPHGSISITASREGDEVVVRVRDSGIGITPEMLPRVFELFAQERQALDRHTGGLGLGLAIVRSLVALHGGSVSAHSEGSGRGSEFVVRLPAAEPTVAGASAPSHREVREASRPVDAAGKRVLIVDDNFDAADMLAEALEGAGFDTRVAHDGPEALRIAEEFHPEVALLDIGLPVMDGYELARRLHELPASRDAKLVAVTGYGQPKDRLRSAEAGFAVHLVKPIRMRDVEKAITG